MASKQELIDKIQTIAKRVYASKVKDNTLGVTPDDVDFDTETFPVLTKFPILKKVVTDLLTDQYEMFISDIQWVAPRPTTFKVVLANGQFFYFIYTERSWIAQVEGKKYYLLNINEEEQASESIARILRYGGKAEPEKAEVPTGGETPADEPVPASEETPAPEGGEETPPAEEPAEVEPTVPA
jgi:hypothetical protein